MLERTCPFLCGARIRHGLVGLVALAACSCARSQPIVERFEGPDSAYSERLVRVMERWHSIRHHRGAAAGIQIACIATLDADAYVGIVRRTKIDATLGAVEEVLDDVTHYSALFPGTVEVRVVARSSDGARFTTAWEQRMPVFFLPNVAYELSHFVDKSSPGLHVYRYKLRRSETLTASDGLVVLESLANNATLLTEYGFFSARPNPLPTSTLWRHSVRGAFLSIAAVKLRAENLAWSYGRVAAEAERLAVRTAVRIDECVAERQARQLQEDVDPFMDLSR